MRTRLVERCAGGALREFAHLFLWRADVSTGRRIVTRPRDKGFTLLEILLAIALSALLLVTVYSTYFSIARSIDATLGTQELLETGRIVLEMIKRDVRGISGLRFPFVSTQDEINGKLVASVVFVTSTPSSTNPFRWNKVGYTLIQDRQGQWVFIKKAAKNPDDDLDRRAASRPRQT